MQIPDDPEPSDRSRPIGKNETPAQSKKSPQPDGEQYIGNYQLAELIGSGAMGDVYLARHRRFAQREYAIKLIRREISTDAARQRFEREITAMGGLVHPNLVYASDAGVDHDRLYLVMEYVRGQDLQVLIDKHGPFRVGQAIEIVRQICLGIAHAHSHGVVHRDIKPANVILSEEDSVKVLDLGIASLQGAEVARMTSGGDLMGTAAYLAPELWEDASNASPASDVYAIGCTTYCLLTGDPPFAGENYTSITEYMAAHCGADPTPLNQLNSGVSTELSQIILRSLHKLADRRFQDAAEFAEQLQPYCEPLTSAQTPFVSDDRVTRPRVQSIPKSQTSPSPGQTSLTSFITDAIGGINILLTLTMVAIALLCLSMAYFGNQATEAWKFAFGKLGNVDNKSWLGFALDVARIVITVPLVMYALTRYYSREARWTLSPRRWSAGVILVRVTLIVLLGLLSWSVYQTYWLVDHFPTQLSNWAAKHAITEDASAQLASSRWYFGYTIVTHAVLPTLAIAFPILWFLFSDLSKLGQHFSALRIKQAETAFARRMAENLHRFGSELRDESGRILAATFAAIVLLHSNYWQAVFSPNSIRSAFELRLSFLASLGIAASLLVMIALILFVFVCGFEITRRSITRSGNARDEEELSRYGASWLIKTTFLNRLSGVGCLSILLIVAHGFWGDGFWGEGFWGDGSWDKTSDAKNVAIKTTDKILPEPLLTESPSPDEPTWIPPRCQAAPDATLVTIEVFGIPQRLYSKVLLQPNFGEGDGTGDDDPNGNGSTPMIPFVLIPQTDSQSPPSFYMMQTKVPLSLFKRFEKAYPERLNPDALDVRASDERDADPQSPIYHVTGIEAIEFADLVCGGMLPTPEQWDVAFGRGLDLQKLEDSIVAPESYRRSAKQTQESTGQNPWGCLEMGSGGLELTRYDTRWRRIVPHSEPTDSLQLRGWSQFSEEGPLRLKSWEESGLPDNLFFGSRPVNEPSEEVSFRVVLQPR
ncbi:Serine/threonine-protein kinase PknB [Novipirellula aureliae]|uniref:Serine/threonine-protein kinase PknB n=2 Tax=Novipirellula aureliae TaxID=2527966 RepID=A0A5C6DUD0_9BACT|nr:Serine/threonine-protein kinase PknB [Novipirellula aureliae]